MQFSPAQKPCIASSFLARRALLVAVLSVAVLGAVAFGAPSESHAQTRRALLVGIDTYSGRAHRDAAAAAQDAPDGEATDGTRGSGRVWRDLRGAANDVAVLRELLTARYGFAEENTRMLLDTEATRAGILAAIRTHLIEPSQPGDVVFFHYSGHGSFVENTASDEADRLDETIVPADSYEGAQDIRDKDLRRLFHELLEKGVDLTLVFDSCHSGSITRGLAPGDNLRYIEPSADPIHEEDADLPPPTQEHPRALVISSAQDSEKAEEDPFRQGDAESWRGVFSWALAYALRTSPVDAPAQQVFARARAVLKSRDYPQEPVLAGSEARQAQALFGGGSERGGADGRTMVAVIRASAEEGVLLQGGRALGLGPGTELCAAPAEAGVSAGEPCLRVEASDGLTRATARITRGATTGIAPGDLFVVTQWAAGGPEPLRFWMPPALPDAGAVAAAEQALDALRREAGGHAAAFTWVTDPTRTPPSHVITHRGDGWHLFGIARADTPLGAGVPDVERARVALAAAAAEMSDPPALYVQLPPPEALAVALRERVAGEQGTGAFADAPDAAHYHLAGAVEDEGAAGVPQPTYAWIYRPATAGSNATASTMPARTRGVVLPAAGVAVQAAQALSGFTRQLGRIWGWLQLALESPPDEGAFPYTLAGFEDMQTGEHVALSDTLRWGQCYRALLSADSLALQQAQDAAADGTIPVTRYVYLFYIGEDGGGGLLFPNTAAGSVENDVDLRTDLAPTLRFPQNEATRLFRSSNAAGEPRSRTCGSGGTITVTEPTLDTVFMLTSAEPIPTHGFNFPGVRGETRGESLSPLGRLLFETGGGTRGLDAEPATVPTGWSLVSAPMVGAAPPHRAED